ncbi:hypothetical protein BBO_06362 [Beauveria brongniartii RCEF 3172]|uniref:Ankyrin 2,3/unc44 n=1 Tax=Beauveria brongniartii RCEF 3172 TaxID=1081107 RepID=A0A167BAW3_9HYPO|nr:hypothetical protein BBO_06362 [Beauveria brongniartii RCEF 3172]
MLELVAKDPEQHRHLLQPYWRRPGVNYRPLYQLDWEVFHRQLRQHKAFRTWQLDNRGIIEEPDFNAYVEQQKAYLRKHWRGRGIAEIEANPESLKGPNTEWERLQSKRARERRPFREQGCSSFAEYHAALQRRLAAHGVSEKTALLADPRKQDALAEWHEYLGFECWWHDGYTRAYNGHLKRYDENCKFIWKFIRRHECEFVTSDHTPEFIEHWMSENIWAQKRSALWERGIAREKIEEAQSKVEKARQHIGMEPVDGGHEGITPHALDDALKRLAKAEKGFKELDRLDNAIAQVEKLGDRCSAAKGYVDSKPALIQWVIDQIPLIKAEMKVKAQGSATSGSRKKRTRQDGEDASALRRPKLQKLAELEEMAESEATATLVSEEMVEPEKMVEPKQTVEREQTVEH